MWQRDWCGGVMEQRIGTRRWADTGVVVGDNVWEVGIWGGRGE